MNSRRLVHDVNNALAVLMLNLDLACDGRGLGVQAESVAADERLEVLADARDAARRLQVLLRRKLPGVYS